MAEELENRKCAFTGKTKSKSELLRFTLLKDGNLIPDFNKKLGGKGIYFSNSKNMLETMVKTAKLGKILHKPIKVDPNIPFIVEQLLAAKGLEALNLARKSGNLVLGFEKIKEKILKNKVAFVVESTNAGTDGKQKMSELCKNIEILTIYDSQTFEKAFSRETVVYLAVLNSEITSMVYKHLKRYENYLNG